MLRKACQKMAWNTQFLAKGIIMKCTGNVLPVGVLIAMTNNSCLYILVTVSLERSQNSFCVCESQTHISVCVCDAQISGPKHNFVFVNHKQNQFVT